MDARGKKNVMKLPEAVAHSLASHCKALNEDLGPTNRAGVAGIAKAKKVKK